MSQETAIKKALHPERLDVASQAQNLASAPTHSSWVGASAGTGKTKVLSDRVLRLLLPQEDHSGTEPHKILCLTFTKAGAAEMHIRITERLAKWASQPLDKLAQDLETLTGHTPDKHQIEAARQLFARVVDAPGGLNVMTIHAFCESVLRRFPVEAGLPPSFEKLEDPRPLLKTAVLETITAIQSEAKTKSQYQKLLRHVGADDLGQLVGALFHSHRLDFENGALQFAELYETQARARLQIKPETTYALAAQNFLIEARPFFEAIARHCQNLPSQSNTIIEYLDKASRFQHWTQIHSPSPEEIRTRFDQDFMKNFGERGFKSLKRHKDVELNALCQRLGEVFCQFSDTCAALESAEMTGQLFAFAHLAYVRFTKMKERQGLLEFNDLITRTADLFQGRLFGGNLENAFEWVLYRLDGGIDHILVDEAQDTNSDQWAVIDTLTKPLTAGKGAHENIFRSLFVVGDDKQSIYGFQGAEPGIFDDKRADYKDAFSRIDHPFKDVPLNVSFRTQAPILDFIDHFFASSFLRDSLTRQNVTIKHLASKMVETGTVTLWPLEEGAPERENTPWPLPQIDKKGESPEKASDAKLAEKMAGEIADWINRPRLLQTNDGLRPVSPDDILILLRRRSPFQKDLVRELKRLDVPVEGLDRMILTDHIAIQDVLAAAKVALLHDDDYALGCLLKSPFVGWDDTQLMQVSFQRTAHERLYNALLKDPSCQEIIKWLSALEELAQTQTPYGFFAILLASPCPADPKGSGWRAIYRRLSIEAFDPLETFLGNASSWISNRHYQGLQAFVSETEKAQTEVKREMEKGNGRVRIMTAHGAKGLQAPIVFLADAARSKQSFHQKSAIETRLFDDPQNGTVFATKEARSHVPALQEAQHLKEKQDLDEYRRLLYVAMTRAEDELHICGSINDITKLSEESWYAMAERLFLTMEQTPLPGYAIETDAKNRKIFRKTGVKTQTLLAEADTDHSQEIQLTLPQWIFTPVEAHEEKTRILQPSKAALPDERLISPLDPHVRAEGERRFKRGLIIHAALQYVPDLPPHQRETALSHFLSQKAYRLTSDQQEDMATEILRILNDPDFAPVFGEGSRAEVPILGEAGAEKTRISGQVDRLVILPDKVLIIDYKTNRPAPENPEDIPEAYRAQLKAYKEILARIYPDRHVSCGLLWTHIPRLVKLNV